MKIKRPFVWILASYLAGLGIYRLPFSFPIVIGGISFLFLLYWLNQRRKKKKPVFPYYFLFMLPVFLITGYFLLHLQLSPNPLDSAFERETNGNVTGILEKIEEKEDYISLTLKKCRVDIYKSKIYQCNKILIYSSINSDYKIGNTLWIQGKLFQLTSPGNPGQFNEYQYNKMLFIDYKMKAKTITVTDGSYSVFYQYLYHLKQKITKVYQKILPGKNAGILTAMILGDVTYLDTDIKDLYRQNGISHILAISGLHVSLLGLSLYKLLRKVNLPLHLSTVICIFFLFTYGILTNFSVSTNRAVVMLVILMAAGFIGRTYDILSASSLSALIILIQSPLQIYNAGFLLSFGAILGIALIHPVLKKMFPVKNAILDGLLVSFSIQVITLPVILYYFYEFPPYSILINLLILPASSIIILLAVTAGVLGMVALPVGMLFIGGVNYILNFYELVCRIGLKLPGHTYLTGRPDFIMIGAYYAIIIVFIAFNQKNVKRKSILLLMCLGIIFFKPDLNSFTATFLDVGQGDGIVIKTPGGSAYLIDGGSSDVKKVGQYRIETYLKATGTGIIDYAIMTHADSDHISGLIELLTRMKGRDKKGLGDFALAGFYDGNIVIHNLILPGISCKDDAYRKLEFLAKSKGVRVIYINTGDRIRDGKVTFTCLHPAPEFKTDSRNAYSTVLSIRYGKFDLLLTGDLEEDGEKILLEELEKIAAGDSAGFPDAAFDYDILKVAHHGSRYSTSKAFLEVIRPEFSMISCGKDNDYGHPHKELLDRLHEIGSNSFITAKSGAITVITDGNKIVVKRFKDETANSILYVK